jgi:hypothetical protein
MKLNWLHRSTDRWGIHHHHLCALALSILSVLIVFPQISRGLIISNCVHAFHFEPWAHHRALLVDGERANHILSDSIDGANANLNPTNIKTFSAGRLLQVNFLLSEFATKAFGVYGGYSCLYLYIFVSLMFFTYLFLTRLGVSWGLAVSVALAFTYGSTNMHYYAWAHETQAAVVTLYFLERLLQRNKWSDCCWLLFALINLGGQQLVHVVVFYSFVIAVFATGRIAVSQAPRELLLKFALCGFASLCVNLDYVAPTIFHYTHYFESDYRANYGIRQNVWLTLYTFVFANLYGHPLNESNRWISGSYINTGMFVGSAAFLSACSLGILRALFRRDFLSVFFAVSIMVGICFMYALPFENLERFTGRIPILRMAPPIYFKAVLHLLVAVLGALGLQYLWEQRNRSSMLLGAVSAIVMIVVVSAAWDTYEQMAILNSGPSEYLEQYMPRALLGVIGSIILIACLALCNPWRRLHALKKWLLVPLFLGLAIFETRLHTEGWVPFSQPQNCAPPTHTTDFLKKRVGNSRIIGLSTAAIPSIINPFNYGIEMAAGRMSVSPPYRALLQLADPLAYSSHPTQYLFKLSTDLTAQIWDLADVRFFVAPREVDAEAVVKQHAKGSIKVHRLRDGTIFERSPTPRHAYGFSEATIFRDFQEMQDKVKAGWDARKQIALESDADLLPSQSTNTPFSVEIKNLRKSTNHISLDVTANQDAYILLSELYDPNWKAFGANQTLKTFRSYFFLQGFQVPQGSHSVVLSYQQPYLTWLNALSAFAAFLAVGLFLTLERRRRLPPQ